MLGELVGFVPVLGYFAVVAASVPTVGAVFLLRYLTDSSVRAVRAVALASLAVFLVGLLALAVAIDPAAALVLGAVGAVLSLLFVVAPILVGRAVVGRFGITGDRALDVVVLGWPLALAASLAIFVGPGGFARYNLTFTTGLAAVAGWTAFFGVVLFGPGIAGLGIARVWRAQSR